MLKIPGKMIRDIPEGGFRFNSQEKFWEMIITLDRKEIWHGDISLMNILYDYENNKFYPIDISNCAENYDNFQLTINSNDFDTIRSITKIKNLLERIERNREY